MKGLCAGFELCDPAVMQVSQQAAALLQDEKYLCKCSSRISLCVCSDREHDLVFCQAK